MCVCVHRGLYVLERRDSVGELYRSAFGIKTEAEFRQVVRMENASRCSRLLVHPNEKCLGVVVNSRLHAEVISDRRGAEGLDGCVSLGEEILIMNMMNNACWPWESG